MRTDGYGTICNVVLGNFDPAAGTLRYVNAGHEAPLLLRKRSDRVDRLHDGGPVLGCLPEAKYSAGEVQLSVGDTLILYSDGISEAVNHRAEEFGTPGILRAIANAPHAAPAHLCEHITNAVTAFSASAQSPDDDRTLFVARFSPANAEIRERVPHYSVVAQVA